MGCQMTHDNIFRDFTVRIAGLIDGLIADGALPGDLAVGKFTVEPPRELAHGDLSTNAAMVLAKPAGMNPRAVADLLVAKLSAWPDVTGVDIAGPGFINIHIKPDVWKTAMLAALRGGVDFGNGDILAGQGINVEYVSANPTGPLTVAHARGAVVGDALANLLAKAGANVTREYYVNDAGAQVDTLGRSAFLRYREALGEAITEIPPGMYPGEYLKDVGAALAARDGDRWLAADEAEWLPVIRGFAIEMMMIEIKKDLVELGVEQLYSSERALVDNGAVERAYDELEKLGLIYVGVLEPPKGKKPDDWEPRPQSLFRASDFGDDVDRPLKKSDGSWTYFANDIAYHFDKFRRGGDVLIDVLGADHGGYVKRMQAAVNAITEGKGRMEAKICQIVHVFENGQPVRMSKRAGTFITLRDVMEVVGRDVVRFIMLTRRNDQTLEFDYAKVKEHSKDNPAFYVQYAHARCCSVLRAATERFGAEKLTPAALATVELAPLNDPAEMAVIRQIAQWPRLVEQAAQAQEAHRVAFYLYDLASTFHSLWSKGKDNMVLRFIQDDSEPETMARLALVRAVTLVLQSGLAVIGVKPVEEM